VGLPDRKKGKERKLGRYSARERASRVACGSARRAKEKGTILEAAKLNRKKRGEGTACVGLQELRKSVRRYAVRQAQGGKKRGEYRSCFYDKYGGQKRGQTCAVSSRGKGRDL